MTQPEQKFQAGGISASVWKNEATFDGKQVATHSVTLQKRYKDKSGEWKNSNSLSERDLPNAVVVLTKAYEHLKLRTSSPQQDQSA